MVTPVTHLSLHCHCIVNESDILHCFLLMSKKTKHLTLVYLSLSTKMFLLASLCRTGTFLSAFSCPSRHLILAATMPSPPIARREEDRVVLAGVGPPRSSSE